MDKQLPAVAWDAESDRSYSIANPKPAQWVRQLVETSPIASVVSDPRLQDNPIVAVNQAFIELTEYGPDEILGRNCRFLAGEGTEPWLTEKIRSGVREKKPVLVEILNYKKSGAPFRNAVLVAPIYDEANELLYFLGSQVEIDCDEPQLAASRRERASAMLQTLSPRQFEVTRMVASGLLNKQIAAALGLSEKTVKMHRKLVMEKLELRTSADLIRVAVEAGI
ncbi:LuxR C-terminal-related transcriptional regulator [Citromicrobium bathyomarinum]|uniref:LuxR C-terminal-related transcriptional regulator n=1 Tax=Sphingomonadales TaxID=204457 RepID=UPI000225EC12|nr:LuxR C-terminal-related transcriptional regulator [Citromicrobium sp. JLT1363]MBL4792293.1 PAS domain-containing protein [Citromicrobium sp.]MBO79991.1 histidine kinase [Citromicrobium sp.]|tara:strand:- start:2499 stop:3167 length:669 start_codon:yes stop_codon:yes gene_type:complete